VKRPLPIARPAALLAAVVALGAGCASASPESEPIGEVSSALAPSDPVSMAVTDSCTTSSVRGLATQLVEEIQCLQPGTFASIDGVAGLALAEAVFPYLQTPAAAAVVGAQADRGVTMNINSALRTLPQQYLLYRWYKAGRCGISLAAAPGNSNHESGLAVDIEDDTGWRSFMTARQMKWLGASDRVHFDYVGSDATDIGGVSVRAFQILWNKNHPEDLLDVDGAYGTETDKRVALSPVGGFALGAECNEAGVPPLPPAVDAGASPAPLPANASPPAEAGGCSCRTSSGGGAPAAPGAPGAPAALLAPLAIAMLLARRRRA
jgi:hypothetical protein